MASPPIEKLRESLHESYDDPEIAEVELDRFASMRWEERVDELVGKRSAHDDDSPEAVSATGFEADLQVLLDEVNAQALLARDIIAADDELLGLAS